VLTSLSPRLQAANYLNIKALLDLTCMTVANMIKGESPRLPRRPPTPSSHPQSVLYTVWISL